MIKHLIKKWTSKTKIQSGFYYTGMPEEVYFKHSSVSRSAMSGLLADPFKYHNRKDESKPSRVMNLGSAVHCLLLEPKKFEKEYMLLPEVASRKSKEYLEQAEIYGVDHVFINTPANTEVDNIKGMVSALKTHDKTNEILKMKGWSELSGFWTDSTGVMYKHRFDYLTEDGIALDIKTTSSASNYKIKHSFMDYRYDMQGVFYSYMFEQITGTPIKEFLFGFVETSHPYKVTVVAMTPETISIAKSKMVQGMNKYTKYLKGDLDTSNNAPILWI